MTAALSDDLRTRVVQVIEDGLSRRQAAARFNVSVASAVRWHQIWRRTGAVTPRPFGGDRYTHRSEPHAPMILAWIDETKDLTLQEIRLRLADQGISMSYGALWRLLDRHDYTLKKRQPTQQSKIAQTLRPSEKSGLKD